MMKRAIAGLLFTTALAAPAAECPMPLPEKNSTVSDYLRQINRGSDSSVTAQLHAALYDLIEYSPMGCSDAEPDDAYSRFRVRTASRDEKGCAWLRLGIVPPGAAAGRKPTPVLCTLANARVGGWSCRFMLP